MTLRGNLLGLLLYGRTHGLWEQTDSEIARVLALDRQVDLVRTLGGSNGVRARQTRGQDRG